MKHIMTLVLSLILLTSCDDGKEDQVILTDSSGNINQLSVIMPNDQWQGEIGEAVRKVLAAPVDGLPQQEPLFTISQMPPQSFSGFGG